MHVLLGACSIDNRVLLEATPLTFSCDNVGKPSYLQQLVSEPTFVFERGREGCSGDIQRNELVCVFQFSHTGVVHKFCYA